MRIVIAAVGKMKTKALAELLADYYKRIGRYAKFEEIEIKDAPVAVIEERFGRLFGDRSRVVALEVLGKVHSSEGLSKIVERCENDGVQELVFLIGGSYGLPKSVSDRAHVKLSLSAMTLPHQLARLMLAEQVYRAFTILRGEPYNH